MEDTRITFETAKLAKEKGFYQEPNRLKIPYYNYKGEFKGDVKDWLRKYLRNEDTSDVESVSAPTQSLLAKWLREKHGILTNPIFSYNDGKWVIHIESIKLAKIDDNSVLISGIDFQPSLFNTYEDAYEIGLQEALKLI